VLRHYGRAIRLLQPHFSASTRTSVRIAVITCLVFVYLQLLRQQHKTAHALQRHTLVGHPHRYPSISFSVHSQSLPPRSSSVDMALPLPMTPTGL
jgi:hypothetical protein